MKSIILFALILSGCSTIEASKGDWYFKRASFGTLTNVGELELTEDGPGKITVRIKALQSDQVQSLKAVAEGFAAGMAKTAP